MIAAVAGLLLMAAALVPLGGARARRARRLLGGLGVLALLPALGDPGARPFVLLAAGATVLAAPVSLVLAAGGAVVVALQPQGWAPVAAAVAGLAVAAAARTLGAGVRLRAGDAPLIGGALLVLVLLTCHGGALLSWTLPLTTDAGPVVVPLAGTVLGLTLLTTLAGVLVLGAARLAPEMGDVRPFGLVVLKVALAAGLVGVIVAVGRAVSLEGVTEAGARALALIVLGVGVLGAGLLEATGDENPEDETAPLRPDVLGRTAVALAILAALAAGVEGWLREGTYATALTAASAATVLLGLLALEEGIPLAPARWGLFLLALVGMAVV